MRKTSRTTVASNASTSHASCLRVSSDRAFLFLSFARLLDIPAARGTAAAAAAAAAAAKSRQRPQSSASTSSVQSATMDHAGFNDMYAGQWITSGHAHAKGPHMSPEDIILHATSHMQTSNPDFPMDGPMTAASMADAHVSYQQQQRHPMARHPLPTEQYAGNASFAESDSQMLDRDDNDDGDSMVGHLGAPRPAASRSSANNELEMRQLFGANRHRNLQDVAGELHGNERGPNSERTRQVFAMLWYAPCCPLKSR